ncbi:uncharacterized protein [Centruroides vittatus]|uniref:uncharacterized protein n=1 Tax=Centruroides vittatus TaxID=120091 RepID=UPI00350EB24D
MNKFYYFIAIFGIVGFGSCEEILDTNFMVSCSKGILSGVKGKLSDFCQSENYTCLLLNIQNTVENLCELGEAVVAVNLIQCVFGSLIYNDNITYVVLSRFFGCLETHVAPENIAVNPHDLLHIIEIIVNELTNDVPNMKKMENLVTRCYDPDVTANLIELQCTIILSPFVIIFTCIKGDCDI